jgi:serine/threonine protein kinase
MRVTIARMRVTNGPQCAERAPIDRMSSKLRKALLLPMLLAGGGAAVDAHAAAAPIELDVARDVDAQSNVAEDLDVDAAIALSPATDLDADLDRDPDSPEAIGAIGPYRLLRALGSGGMGRVYLARSIELPERVVALKVMRDDFVSPESLAQFDLERRALAAANHDHVARLLDWGTSSDGQPWIALEHVEGTPILEHCDEKRLDVEQRLLLFADVCRAVQHLHERGILHGDLKPANILIAECDGRAVPKIIDLGLAHLPASSLADPNSIAGTLAYMAPEQLAVEPGSFDERCDVYSLGVVLHELLAGSRPLGDSGRMILDVPAAVFGGKCAPPSTQLATADRGSARRIARARRASVHGLRFRLRGALDAIVLGAIAPKKSERCASAAELASALERDAHRHAVSMRALRWSLLVAATAIAGFASGLLAAA